MLRPVLKHYVQETGAITLADGLAKMTINRPPAQRAAPAMARKGRLQQGADADVVFDPRPSPTGPR